MTEPAANPRAIATRLQPHVAQLHETLAQPALDPTAIINLIAALLPEAIGLYNSLMAQYSGPAKSVEEILAQADANADTLISQADQQGLK